MSALQLASISDQDTTEMGGRGSVLARQKRDHMRLGGLLRRLGDAPADDQPGLLLDIYRLVFPHAFAEEAILWPVIRRVLPDGHQLTLQVEIEHQQINELVTALETMEPGSAAHRELMSRMIELLRQDVRDEEDILLPRLQARLTPVQLRLLGVAWEVVRAIAPTRAHPIVARRPPGNILSALPLALLDRFRDLVDSARASGGASAPLLDSVGTALRKASHAVEHLPGMRRGEDPTTRVPASGRDRRAAAFLCIGLASAAILLASRRRRGGLSASG
jgi:hypothetical protein